MANPKGQLYCKSLALLIWLQNIDRCTSGNYNIDLPEMEFLASKLSPQECYDFYNQLSHRKANHGANSIYAQKEKMQQLPCISLLTTWLTDPAESPFRSHESIELKLRNIGRKDLARWIVKIIENSLQRKRMLDDEEINRRGEESEQNGSIVIDRIGGKIMPIVSLEDQETGIKSENIGVDIHDNSCLFWQIFYSVLIVLLLILLFACCYRFFYRKLTCNCRRFDSSEDRKCCLPEQKYGTTSGSDLSPKKTRKTWNFFPRKKREHKNSTKNSNFVSTNKCSSASDSNEETSIIEEKRSLLLNLTDKLTLRNSKKKISKSRLENFNPDKKLSSQFPKNANSTELFYETLQQCFQKEKKNLTRKKAPNSRSENILHLKKIGSRNFNKIDCSCSEKMLRRSFSNEQLHFSRSTSSRISSSRKLTRDEKESDKIDSDRNYEEENANWTSCSCNELSKPKTENSPTNSEQRLEIFVENQKFYNRQSEINISENENPEWNSCSCIEMSETHEKKSPTPSQIFPTEIPTNTTFSEEQFSDFHNDLNSQSEVTSIQEKTLKFCTSKKCPEAQKNSLASIQISPTRNHKNVEVRKDKSSEIKNFQEKTPNFTLCTEEKCPEAQKNSLASTQISLTKNQKNAELRKDKSSEIKNFQEKTPNITLCTEEKCPQAQKNSLASTQISPPKNQKNTELRKYKSSEMKNFQEKTPNFTLCSEEKCPEAQKNSLASTQISPSKNLENAELPNEKTSKIKNVEEQHFFFCTQVPELQIKNSLEQSKKSPTENAKNEKILKEKCSGHSKNDYLRYSRGDADSELSETYNELGMLFSEELKRQWRPCRRNYCPLSRNLRMRGNHDEQKCRTRFRANFGYRIIRIGERPACSSAEICRDTYDEFELMKATRKKDREKVARSIFERRKRFLDQPCLSPASGNNSDRN